jgi:hypothetical protein
MGKCSSWGNSGTTWIHTLQMANKLSMPWSLIYDQRCSVTGLDLQLLFCVGLVLGVIRKSVSWKCMMANFLRFEVPQNKLRCLAPEVMLFQSLPEISDRFQYPMLHRGFPRWVTWIDGLFLHLEDWCILRHTTVCLLGRHCWKEILFWSKSS